ncbi:MAG TPA: sulfatase-like hydrolase/transferase [Thermoanaerobaculia bacterium]|nr:sulfatase-like hydrolase/transferase [Thermoanaerobaculia bacterium]
MPPASKGGRGSSSPARPRRPLTAAGLAAALAAMAAMAAMAAVAAAAVALALAAGHGLPAAGSGPAAGAAAAGPALRGADVVLITVDTLRADALGFAGNRLAATPTLDRLAAAGRVYPDAHAHNVVTLPSHTNILTGLYPFQHGVRENSGFRLPPSIPTLGTYLRRAGYATAAFVGAFPLDARFGLGAGFDRYDDAFPRGSNPDQYRFAQRRGDEVVRPALAWWRARRGSRRFLWVHIYDPHAPYEPPEPFASRFKNHPYLGEVAAADSFLAPLLDPMLSGKEPAALVVFTADHGESLGEHGELTHGLLAYEATLHVPLVIWGPGVPPGRDLREARHVDIVPTVLAALRLPVPAGLPGRSLLAPAPAGPVQSYFEALTGNLTRGWAPLRGMLRDHRKLIDLPLPELYNLRDDPGEAHNVYDQDRPTARALASVLPAESHWPPAKGRVSSEEAARLASLGYLSATAPHAGAYTAADDPKRLIGMEQQMQESLVLYQERRFAEAAALCRKIIAERPTIPAVYESLALALRQLERHDEAIAALKTAMAKGLDTEGIRRQLGQALCEVGRAPEAVAVLAPIAAAGDAETVTAYGVALGDAGRYQEAIAELKKAAAASPADPAPLEDLGVVALHMDRPAEARRYLESALRLNDRLPVSWNTLGVALFRQQQTGAALDAWEKAVAIDPRQYDALYNIGLVAADAGKPKQAAKALERFVETAPPARFAGDIAKARALLEHLKS